MNNMITIEQFNELKPIIKTDTILQKAFDEEASDINRVRSKIYRKSPEFTDDEATKIMKVLSNHGIKGLQ